MGQCGSLHVSELVATMSDSIVMTNTALTFVFGCRLRVVEHNILVVSQYYSRITMQRLSQLLCLNAEEVGQSTLKSASTGMPSLLCVSLHCCYLAASMLSGGGSSEVPALALGCSLR